MAKPIFHALHSAQKFGGKTEDYQAIHCYMDSSKASHPQMSHRLVFHSTFGIELIKEIFGKEICNSDKIAISVEKIAEQHIIEDLGFLPTLDHYSQEFPENHPLIKSELKPAEWQAKQDVKKYGGNADDYLKIHQKMLSNISFAGKAIFQSAVGTYLIEKLFGVMLFNSQKRIVAIRDLAENHILRNYGKIPTLSDWLDGIEKLWMAGLKKKQIIIVD